MVLVSQTMESMKLRKLTKGVVMNFRKIVILCLIIFVFTLTQLSADENFLVGEWEGSIAVPGQTLEVIIEFIAENNQII